jgi:hypothetical protein
VVLIQKQRKERVSHEKREETLNPPIHEETLNPYPIEKSECPIVLMMLDK